MKYEATISYWEGPCYMTVERFTLKAETLDGAINEVKALSFDDDEGDYDYEVVIEDEDGEGVHTEHFERIIAKEKQEEMESEWESAEEWDTNHLGVKRGKWFTWTSNGGDRGAHDRMDGQGRWVEHYEMPEEIEASQALEWLTTNTRMDTDEALDDMVLEHGDCDKCDLVREVGQELWREDHLVGVFRVQKNLYLANFSDCSLLDEDEAKEFVAEHDPDAEEQFEESLQKKS